MKYSIVESYFDLSTIAQHSDPVTLKKLRVLGNCLFPWWLDMVNESLGTLFKNNKFIKTND